MRGNLHQEERNMDVTDKKFIGLAHVVVLRTRLITIFILFSAVSAIWASDNSEFKTSLSFAPWRIMHGSNSVLTAKVTGGVPPYSFEYETRPGGTTNWRSISLSGGTNAYAWPANMQARVRVVDSSNSTSTWSAAASLVVIRQALQPSSISTKTTTSR